LPDRDTLYSRNFLLLVVANLAFFLGFQALVPVLPLYLLWVGGPESAVGLLIAVMTLPALAARFGVGPLIDRYGKVPFLVAGGLAFLAGTALFGLFPTVLAIFVLRGLQGFGFGAATSASSALAADLAPAARRGEAMGVYGLGGTLASATAPAIVVFILATAGSGALGFGAVFALATAAGLVGVGTALALRAPHRRMARENRRRTALVSRAALLPALAMVFVIGSFAAVVAFLPILAAQRQIESFGLYYTAQALAIALSRVVAGRASDRFGRLVVVAPAILLMALCAVTMGWVTSLPFLLLNGALYGLALGSVQPTVMAMVVDRAPPEERGVALSTVLSAYDVGIGGWAIGLGLVLGAAGFEAMFLAAGALALVGLLILVLGLRREARQTPRGELVERVA
jgi:MFS family permease